jgi:hypothetical protein
MPFTATASTSTSTKQKKREKYLFGRRFEKKKIK